MSSQVLGAQMPRGAAVEADCGRCKRTDGRIDAGARALALQPRRGSGEAAATAATVAAAGCAAGCRAPEAACASAGSGISSGGGHGRARRRALEPLHRTCAALLVHKGRRAVGAEVGGRSRTWSGRLVGWISYPGGPSDGLWPVVAGYVRVAKLAFQLYANPATRDRGTIVF